MKKVAILGYGGRGKHYAGLCATKGNMKDFEIVAVIDTSPEKCQIAQQSLKLADSQIFSCIEDFIAAPKVADIMFICT